MQPSVIVHFEEKIKSSERKIGTNLLLLHLLLTATNVTGCCTSGHGVTAGVIPLTAD